MFNLKPLEHLDGNLSDLLVLLKRRAHLPLQQAHQKVVSTEVVSQGVVQLEICGRPTSTKTTKEKLNDFAEMSR